MIPSASTRINSGHMRRPSDPVAYATKPQYSEVMNYQQLTAASQQKMNKKITARLKRNLVRDSKLMATRYEESPGDSLPPFAASRSAVNSNEQTMPTNISALQSPVSNHHKVLPSWTPMSQSPADFLPFIKRRYDASGSVVPIIHAQSQLGHLCGGASVSGTGPTLVHDASQSDESPREGAVKTNKHWKSKPSILQVRQFLSQSNSPYHNSRRQSKVGASGTTEAREKQEQSCESLHAILSQIDAEMTGDSRNIHKMNVKSTSKDRKSSKNNPFDSYDRLLRSPKLGGGTDGRSRSISMDSVEERNVRRAVRLHNEQLSYGKFDLNFKSSERQKTMLPHDSGVMKHESTRPTLGLQSFKSTVEPGHAASHVPLPRGTGYVGNSPPMLPEIGNQYSNSWFEAEMDVKRRKAMASIQALRTSGHTPVKAGEDLDVRSHSAASNTRSRPFLTLGSPQPSHQYIEKLDLVSTEKHAPMSPGPVLNKKQTQTFSSPLQFQTREVHDKVFNDEHRREVQAIIRKKIAQHQQNLKLSVSLYNKNLLPNMRQEMSPQVESIKELQELEDATERQVVSAFQKNLEKIEECLGENKRKNKRPDWNTSPQIKEKIRVYDPRYPRSLTMTQRAQLNLGRTQMRREQLVSERPQLDAARLTKNTLLQLQQQKYQGEDWQEKLVDRTGVDNGVKKLLLIDQAGGHDETVVNDKKSARHLTKTLTKGAGSLDIISVFREGDNGTKLAGSQRLNFFLGLGLKQTDLFKVYLDGEEQAQRHIAAQLEKKQEFADMMRTAFQPCAPYKFARDPKFQYFMKCYESSESVLPVLHYVAQKTLLLESYTLSIGHAKALAKACEYFGEAGINRIVFDNCGIDDEEFAEILRGCARLRDFKKIIYRYNVLQDESIQSMRPLLEAKIPNHLEELRVENCKLPMIAASRLLQLIDQRSSLRKLGLVNVSFNDYSALSLCNFVKDSLYLDELDISWSQVRPRHMRDLIALLEDNRKLRNVSFKNVLLFGDMTSHGADCVSAEVMLEWTAKQAEGKVPTKSEKLKQKIMMDTIHQLCNFIKRNSNLTHMNLESTGLREDHLIEVANALRRAKHLQGIHLSGNEVTQQVIDYMIQRVHAINFKPCHLNPFRDLPSAVQLKEDLHRIQSEIAAKEKQRADEKLKKKTWEVKKDTAPTPKLSYLDSLTKAQQKALNNGLNETAHLQFLKKQKRLDAQPQSHVRREEDRPLFLTRQLGHKLDMPGSGQWKLISEKQRNHSDCWLCDLHAYGLILWNEHVGKVDDVNYDLEDRDHVVSKLRHVLNDDYLKARDQGRPFVTGTFTNWEPMPMFEIVDFCFRVDVERVTILSLAKKEGLVDLDCESLDGVLSGVEYHKLRVEYDKYHKEDYSETWMKLIQRTSRYQRPVLVNGDKRALLKRKDTPLYVFAAMMSCGRQDYVISNRLEDGTYDHHLGTCLARHRDEEVPIARKKHKKKLLVDRKFVKEHSVFAQWRLDDDGTLRKCLAHDMRYWKVGKFVKQPSDLEAVVRRTRAHFEMLKNSHIVEASISYFPYISINEYMQFARRCNLIDSKFKMSAIDRLFIATNYEVEAQDENPDKQLMRFEFIEILLRIAREKYLTAGPAKTIDEAYQMILEKHVMPASRAGEWKDWRLRVLYTVEVNDVLHANLNLLAQLYSLVTTGVKTKQAAYLARAAMDASVPTQHLKQMPVEKCIKLFTDDTDVGLSLKDAVYCMGMSKMTVINENEQPESKKYKTVAFVEFLEMIARVAQSKFTESELEDIGLNAKIEFVLDDLFKVLGEKRKPVNIDEEDEGSASDSDY